MAPRRLAVSCLSPGELGVGCVRYAGRLVGPIRLSYGPIGRIDQILTSKDETRSWARDRPIDLNG
jgi:hypothetical protein